MAGKKRDISHYAERAAQAIYDLRDAIPSSDARRWWALDKQARSLSIYGEKMRKSKGAK